MTTQNNAAQAAQNAIEWATKPGAVENFPATARAHINGLASLLLSKLRSPAPAMQEAVLTDAEIREIQGTHLVTVRSRDALIASVIVAGRAIEAAVLSKLRAPVADERAAFEAWMASQNLGVERDGDSYSLTYARRAWDTWQARAALASVPAVKRTPEHFKPPFDNCSFRMCDLPGQCRGEGKCHHPAPTISGASTPVAGEAVAWRAVDRPYLSPTYDPDLVKSWERNGWTVRPLVYGDAAPQASAEAGEAQDWPTPAQEAEAAKQWDVWAHEMNQCRDASLEQAARICDAEGQEWDSDAVVADKNYAQSAALRIRALKSTPAPTAAEGGEDDMLTIAYLAGAQAEKERAALADRQSRHVNTTGSGVDIDRQQRAEDGQASEVVPTEPLRVFAAGIWTYDGTGQAFSHTDLDEAAFVTYRDRAALAARKEDGNAN